MKTFHTAQKGVILGLLLLLTPALIFSQARTSILSPGNKQISYRSFRLPGPRIEFGVVSGLTMPLTDSAPEHLLEQPGLGDFRIKSTGVNSGMFFRYRFNDLYAIKSSVSYLRLTGDDSWASSPEVIERQLEFRNQLVELSAVGEFYLPRLSAHDVRSSWVDVILFAGIAGVFNNPELKGPIIDYYDVFQRYDEDLRRRFVMAFPTGMMVQYNYANKWTMGLKGNFRWTFHDFLDGFNRPTSQRPDYYFTLNLSFSYVIDYNPRVANREIFRSVFRSKRRGLGTMGL